MPSGYITPKAKVDEAMRLFLTEDMSSREIEYTVGLGPKTLWKHMKARGLTEKDSFRYKNKKSRYLLEKEAAARLRESHEIFNQLLTSTWRAS